MNYQTLVEKFNKAIKWIRDLDWSSPRVLLTAGAILIVPFIAKYLVLTGLMVGALLAVSVLAIVEKMPARLKKLIHDNPITSDIILSSLAVWTIGSYLGTGLTIAIAFVFTDLFLHWGLGVITDPSKEPNMEPQPA